MTKLNNIIESKEFDTMVKTLQKLEDKSRIYDYHCKKCNRMVSTTIKEQYETKVCRQCAKKLT